jgi:phosphotransferase system  glucose/maltose/N-acetylglucosamine-specific IIC component
MLIGGVLASVNADNEKVIAAQGKIEAITMIKDEVKQMNGTWDLKQIESLTENADSIFTAAKINADEAAALKTMISESKNSDDLYIQLTDESDSVLVPYNYTVPLVIFACFGISALLVAIYLKRYDKKNKLGLEDPNMK